LREYVERWVNWHRSGLLGLIDKRNRFQRFWLYVIKHSTSLRIKPTRFKGGLSL
jgi:hypothetical protein